MAKKIKIVLKLQLQAGKANPAPPVGTALGPHGINIGQFVKEFNEQSAPLGDTVVPAEVTIYDDRTFTFVLKTPPVAELIKKSAKVAKGSGNPLLKKIGKITEAQVREIAEKKMVDLNTTNVENAMKTVRGTARSMGVEVSA